MTIIGNTQSFAIETTFHPDAERTLARVYGRFRIWIGGVAYGKDDDAATCLACSVNRMRERLHDRGTYIDRELADGVSLDVLNRAVYGLYETLPEDFDSIDAFRASARHYRRLLLAPDGDEAFDDRSKIVHLDLGTTARLVGGRRTDGFVQDWNQRTTLAEWSSKTAWDPKSIADLVLDADLFYRTVENWLAWFESEVQTQPPSED